MNLSLTLNGSSHLAKAIRIALSFVNYSKPINLSTTNNYDDDGYDDSSKCPGGHCGKPSNVDFVAGNFDGNRQSSKPFQSDSIKDNIKLDDYYADYDPMMGVRIACSLLGIIVLFAIFVVYKSHCNAKKAKRLLPYRGSGRSMSSCRSP